jgi:hypothetical protein
VFHPSWWYKHTGITFDEDFFYHPLKRVESERRMERELFERFGQWGLGEDWGVTKPVLGAVHNAAGYIVSEMFGCEIRYLPDGAPQVVRLEPERLANLGEGAPNRAPFVRVQRLIDALKLRYGYVCGDINWQGILNVALDVWGEEVLLKMMTEPLEAARRFGQIAGVISGFVGLVASETGSSSISVNRIVRHLTPGLFVHSECTHTLISEDLYDMFLLPIDIVWSQMLRPFGIHYCGPDPHRFGNLFAKIPGLAFLDVGWGGDIAGLRALLPNTFFSLRVDPVTLNRISGEVLADTIRDMIRASGNERLTGLCCINMDADTSDEQVNTLFRTVAELRENLND